MRNKGRYLAATGLAALGMMATAGPATAGTGSPGPEVNLKEGTCAELEGAIGCFESTGDHVYVHDDKADGWKPSVQWRTDYGRSGECTWTGNSYWTDCNYNMREDSTISFRLIQRSVSSNEIRLTEWRQAYIGE